MLPASSTGTIGPLCSASGQARAPGEIADEPYGLEAAAFTADAIRTAFVEEAAPYLQEPDPTAALLVLLEEAACRWQAALSLEEVVERLAQLPAGNCRR